MTTKLFQEDAYKKSCESEVLEVSGKGSADDPFLLVLDSTVFFPAGGGQPCDLGTIDGIPLAGVFEESGKIFHKMLPVERDGSAGSGSASARWEPGERVSCLLDWERRFDHMQKHCGEHILSGVFFRETGGVNRGFHMGSGHMTIDIDVPGISWEQAMQIEMMTNEIIWSNVPVTVRYYEDRSEAEKLPLRKALAIDEDISIVCVGDESNPADCVACCGTHPSTSGQVGLLKIIKLENYKGMTRVYFNAGKESLADYRNKHRILTELNRKYSSEDKDILEKMKAQDEKNKEIRQELYLLKNTFIAKAADEILQNYEISNSKTQENTMDITAPGLAVREYSYFSANDLLAAAKILTERFGSIGQPSKTGASTAKNAPLKDRPLIVLVSARENIVILVSAGSHDCGKLVRDNAPVWNGKGGGNAAGARVMFQSIDDAVCFVTFIRQVYGASR